MVDPLKLRVRAGKAIGEVGGDVILRVAYARNISSGDMTLSGIGIMPEGGEVGTGADAGWTGDGGCGSSTLCSCGKR